MISKTSSGGFSLYMCCLTDICVLMPNNHEKKSLSYLILILKTLPLGNLQNANMAKKPYDLIKILHKYSDKKLVKVDIYITFSEQNSNVQLLSFKIRKSVINVSQESLIHFLYILVPNRFSS